MLSYSSIKRGQPRLLLLGPVTKDTIISHGATYHNIGGAVYYQSTALASLGADVTAMVTLSPDDKDLLNRFHPEVHVVPVWTTHTMTFENRYPDKDNPNLRIQQAYIPENPILPEHTRQTDVSAFDAIYLLPLCPYDLPLETVRHLSLFEKQLFVGVQGYLRHISDGKVTLQHWADFPLFAPHFSMLFADNNEAGYIANRHPDDLTATARDIAGGSIAEVILTRGDRGAVIATSDGSDYQIPAYTPLSTQDPTGLGDTYMAVYTLQRMAGRPPQEAGKQAAIAATIKLENKGAFTGNLKDIETRITTYNNQ
jgi:sugar/nucleoside kinase (ribokinase family)